MVKKFGNDEKYYLRLNDIKKLSKFKRKDIELSDQAVAMKMVKNDKILALNYKNGKFELWFVDRLLKIAEPFKTIDDIKLIPNDFKFFTGLNHILMAKIIKNEKRLVVRDIDQSKYILDVKLNFTPSRLHVDKVEHRIFVLEDETIENNRLFMIDLKLSKTGVGGRKINYLRLEMFKYLMNHTKNPLQKTACIKNLPMNGLLDFSNNLISYAA